MHRALLAVSMLSVASPGVAQTQDIRQARVERAEGERVIVMAKCTFPDGTLVSKQLVEVAAGASAQEKQAAAELACQPVMDAAIAKCDELASRVEALKHEARVAAPFSARSREVAAEIRRASDSAPPYCTK